MFALRMKILRIRTGRVRTRLATDAQGNPGSWTSAIEKEPVTGPVLLTTLGIEGDEQADHKNHGGPDKAILCYPREHYAKWAVEPETGAVGEGTLGENLEIGGATEAVVCVGDVFRCGEVEVAISQPRQPCWKPAQLHRLPDLTALILRSGRTGWYVRVLIGGSLRATEELDLVKRPNPGWTVARATQVMHFERDPALRAELAALPGLSESWRRALLEKAHP